MTQLETALAVALAKLANIDIVAIIDAAQRVSDVAEQTVGSGVAIVAPPPAVVEPAKRTRKVAEPTAPAADAPKVEPTAQKPSEPPKEPEAAKPAATPTAGATGIDITGLLEGSGPTQKVVKAVFLAAVEKAPSLAALVALNEVCCCGIATESFTEETVPVLKRRMNRWGAAQE